MAGPDLGDVSKDLAIKYSVCGLDEGKSLRLCRVRRWRVKVEPASGSRELWRGLAGQDSSYNLKPRIVPHRVVGQAVPEELGREKNRKERRSELEERNERQNSRGSSLYWFDRGGTLTVFVTR